MDSAWLDPSPMLPVEVAGVKQRGVAAQVSLVQVCTVGDQKLRQEHLPCFGSKNLDFQKRPGSSLKGLL